MEIRQKMQRLLMDMLPEKLKWFLRFIKRSPKVFYEFYLDALSYLNNSCIIEYSNDKEKLLSLITATYHNLEKGMSLSMPRLGFGKQNIKRLITYLSQYQQSFGYSTLLDTPINVLKRYYEFNETKGVDVSWLKADLQKILDFNNTDALIKDNRGGTIVRTKNQINQVVHQVPIDFFYLRHSIRQFSAEPVSIKLIKAAVSVAQKSPVVCNRQSGKVYAILEKDKIVKTLEMQGGARGFLNEVTALFCITVDFRNFNGSGERNQGWIDGGMFAMSFILGLHQQGLGSCSLNWSKNNKDSIAMKQSLEISDSEQIIMFVAAGHLKESFKVAESVRKPIEIVFKEIY
jgi:nitroreductase